MTARDHWRAVWLREGAVFTRREPDRPFWIPEWEVRRLLKRRAA
jgi:hypothetical protein